MVSTPVSHGHIGFTVSLSHVKILNVIDVSTKHTQCQVSLQKKFATSENGSVKFIYHDSNISCSMQYSSYKSCNNIVKDICDSKVNKIYVNKLIITKSYFKIVTEQVI